MNEKENDDIELIKQKSYFFFKNKKPVHITLKKNWFHNGNIKEISADFLIINDFKEGEMPVFFLEIFDVREYTGEMGR